MGTVKPRNRDRGPRCKGKGKIKGKASAGGKIQKNFVFYQKFRTAGEPYSSSAVGGKLLNLKRDIKGKREGLPKYSRDNWSRGGNAIRQTEVEVDRGGKGRTHLTGGREASNLKPSVQGGNQSGNLQLLKKRTVHDEGHWPPGPTLKGGQCLNSMEGSGA